MTLSPLANASLAIQIHAAGAVAALLLGLIQLLLPKGTPRHRAAGYAWVAMMVAVSLSSFWIHELRLWGEFSPIHLLSILTLVALPRAVWLARSGDIRGHRRLMLILFWMALIGAGFFTLAPGRVIHRALFG